MNQIPNNCPLCSNPIVEKKGVSKKTNKPYHFWGCSNYPDCQYVYQEEKPEMTKTSGGFQKAIPTTANHEEIMKSLRIIYTEIESLNKEFKDFVEIFSQKEDV